MTQDQSETIRFLMDPATHGGQAPEHVETHGAHVFLAGSQALKIKRAVRYDYMDLSTLDRRGRMLRRELDLNQPVAPGLYRDVVPITRNGTRLVLNGGGTPVEWVLRMARFPKADELPEVARRGGLDQDLAERLGLSVAEYHKAAPERDADGAALIAAILDELRDAFAGMRAELGDARVEGYDRASRAALARVAPLLTERGATGRVRRCHGDLHMNNIVLIDGRPVPFDALEFDEVLGTCDVLYDLAFLLMDLCHRGHAQAANIALNNWLAANDGCDDSGVAAMPLFLAVRAAIRAMVCIQTDRASDGTDQAPALCNEARAYLDQALAVLSPPPPRLVAVGGLSGSGKTVVSRALAPRLGVPPGAVHLRSDLERKRLARVDPLAKLPTAAYSPAASHEVYAEMMRRAGRLLAAGWPVLLDATWLSPDDRATIRALAAGLGVDFAGLWLEAPDAVLAARVAGRRNDASDADLRVLERQISQGDSPSDWIRVDASGSPVDSVARAWAALGS